MRRGRERRGKEEEKRVVENLEESRGVKDSRSLIEAWARIIAHLGKGVRFQS